MESRDQEQTATYDTLEQNYFLLLRHHNITIKECYSRAAFFSLCMRCGVQLLSGVNLKKTELSILIRTWEREVEKRTEKQSLMATMYVLSLGIVHTISVRWVNKQIEN